VQLPSITSAAMNPSIVKAGKIVYLLPLINTVDFLALILMVE